MALSWIERIQYFFGKEPKYPTWADVPHVPKKVEPVVPEVVKPEPTEFEKIYAKFNPRTDMIVMSRCKTGGMSEDEIKWLDSLGNRVYYFDTSFPVNMALISSR